MEAYNLYTSLTKPVTALNKAHWVLNVAGSKMDFDGEATPAVKLEALQALIEMEQQAKEVLRQVEQFHKTNKDG